MLPVVIGTAPGREEWLADCLESILNTDTEDHRHVLVHDKGGYEVAALRTGFQHFDRFLFLQDSVTILSATFWDVIDSHIGPCWLTGHPPMMLGIHDTTVLPFLPSAVTKEEAITLEWELPQQLTWPTIWPDILDASALRTEHKHGRHNIVLGNALFEKHKGTWR